MVACDGFVDFFLPSRWPPPGDRIIFKSIEVSSIAQSLLEHHRYPGPLTKGRGNLTDSLAFLLIQGKGSPLSGFPVFNWSLDWKPFCSWAVTVAKSITNLRTPLKICPFSSVGERVMIKPPDMAVLGSKRWETTLVGYLLGKKQVSSLIEAIAQRLWGSYELSSVLANSKGFVYFASLMLTICTTFRKEDLGPFFGKPIFLKIWSPGMFPRKDELT
ncbi:hypothetical protein Nepgr_029281 [Nepenthes gracilis]|uniref:Uncharacterized protein n=1 Tax=Nepenthes gracilis TaxID=150966 RepID=A0AAD3TC78_NEPGR|nr:hypothetical protein Nepgr_029281 [Nepenthes gracilis]